MDGLVNMPGWQEGYPTMRGFGEIWSTLADTGALAVIVKA